MMIFHCFNIYIYAQVISRIIGRWWGVAGTWGPRSLGGGIWLLNRFLTSGCADIPFIVWGPRRPKAATKSDILAGARTLGGAVDFGRESPAFSRVGVSALFRGKCDNETDWVACECSHHSKER